MSATLGLQAVITGKTGTGKSWYLARLVGEYRARGLRRRLVLIDRSDQHAGLFGAGAVRVEINRATVTRRWRWRQLLARYAELLVVVECDPASAWPVLNQLADALWDAGDTLLVLEEAQRWTPSHGGAGQLVLLATDARKRGLDWIVVSPQVVAVQHGVATDWVRESGLRVAFAVNDPRQRETLARLEPAWLPVLLAPAGLRMLARDPVTGAITPGQYLIADARSGRAALVDLATGETLELTAAPGRPGAIIGELAARR